MSHSHVFVIDDDDAVRDSLSFLLETHGLKPRAYGSAQAFLDELPLQPEGCVVTDIRMPGMDGLALMKALGARGARLPVIVITGHGDVPMAVRAMKSGAADFIEKPFDSDLLLIAVRQCLETIGRRENAVARQAATQARLETLSKRERQVLDELVEGKSNKAMAAELQISPRTVEIYRANVMQKMAAESLSGLVRMVMGARG